MTSQPPPRSAASPAFASPFIMFISAAIFGYFGFATQWVHTSSSTGQVVVYVVMLDWTLKVSAVAFVLAGLVTFAAPLAGNVVYALVSVIGAALFILVAILDFVDKQHTIGLHPFLLLLFAAWNGYSGWSALKGFLAAQIGRATPSKLLSPG